MPLLNKQALKQFFFTSSQQRILLEDLLSLVEDGVSLSQSIEIIAEESTGIRAEAAQSISHSIASGQGMAVGMEGWFSTIYIELIRSGEKSGLIQQSLQACVSTINQSMDALRTCLSALLYPTLVVLAALVVVVFVKVSVLEQFQKIKPMAQWPDVGRDLFLLASWLQYTWWLLLLVLVALVMGLIYLLRHWVGDWRLKLDRFPGFNSYRQFTAARLMSTLGLLMNNGVMLKNALVIVQAKAKSYLGWHLQQMEVQLARGKLNLADVLDTGLLDRSDMRRLRVLATGNGFAQALRRLGEQSMQRRLRLLRRLCHFAGGALLLLGAAVAMLLVFGLYGVSQVLAF